MKVLIIVCIVSINIYASKGTGGGSGSLSPIVEVANNVLLGTGGNSGSLRVLPQDIDYLNDVVDVTLRSDDASVETLRNLVNGDFNYNASDDRWLLKTKTRILSVKNIELVDHFQNKQTEINNIVNSYRRSFSNPDKRLIKRKLRRDVRFKKYIQEDFKY